MRTLSIVLLSSLTLVAQAAQIQAIKVAGEGLAEVSFLADSALSATPKLSVDDNRIELTFSDTTLSETLVKQVDIPAPHALIQRISTYPAENGGAKVRLIVNGSTDKLRDRVKLQKKDGSIALVLNYPTGNAATIRLLQEESASLETAKPAAGESRAGFGWFRLMLVLVLFAAVGVGAWYFLKFAKKKTGWGGTRRHLIETLAQAPVGDGKASVSILRVGGEFVMVGVTSTQVSMLSHLPKLQAQYEEENALERDSFKEAIAQAARKSGGLGLDA